MDLRFLSDLGERAAKTFVQAFVAYWVTFNSAQLDTLFTVNNLKAAVATALMSVITSMASKPVGNPDSASVLPPQAQPPAPQPFDPTLKPEEAAPAPAPVDAPAPVLDQEQIIAELLRRIQPIAAPPPPPPPPPAPMVLPAPPVAQPLGLLDPTLVGGRDLRSEGNT